MAAVLLPCLESADKGKKGLPEGVMAILLKVLEMLFQQMAEAVETSAPEPGAADVERYRWAMATLFKTTHLRETRTQVRCIMHEA
jgi:hypothetical protein